MPVSQSHFLCHVILLIAPAVESISTWDESLPELVDIEYGYDWRVFLRSLSPRQLFRLCLRHGFIAGMVLTFMEEKSSRLVDLQSGGQGKHAYLNLRLAHFPLPPSRLVHYYASHAGSVAPV